MNTILGSSSLAYKDPAIASGNRTGMRSAAPAAQQAARLSLFNADQEYQKMVADSYTKINEEKRQRDERRIRFADSRAAQEKSHGEGRKQHAYAPGTELDWGGNVVSQPTKKQFYGKTMQSSTVAANDGWFTSDSSDVRLNQRQKRHYENDQRFSAAESSGGLDMPLRSSVYQLGPGGSHDTSNWQTNYSVQCKGERAGFGHKKNKRAGVKRGIRPQFESQANERLPFHERNLAASGNSNFAGKQRSSFGQISMGNAGGVGLKGGNNLLAGLGSAVAEQMLAKNASMPRSASLHAQRFNKELFLDNYNPHAMPGFTGNVRRLR